MGRKYKRIRAESLLGCHWQQAVAQPRDNISRKGLVALFRLYVLLVELQSVAAQDIQSLIIVLAAVAVDNFGGPSHPHLYKTYYVDNVLLRRPDVS